MNKIIFLALMAACTVSLAQNNMDRLRAMESSKVIYLNINNTPSQKIIRIVGDNPNQQQGGTTRGSLKALESLEKDSRLQNFGSQGLKKDHGGWQPELLSMTLAGYINEISRNQEMCTARVIYQTLENADVHAVSDVEIDVANLSMDARNCLAK
jgi:hypothetical protein